MSRHQLFCKLLLVLSICTLLLAISFVAGLAWGSVPLSTEQIWHILQGNNSDGTASAIIWSVRLPRLLLAALTGASLGLAGAAFQGILRNPLADPYIVGTSSGASLGASLAIVFHFSAPACLPWASPVPLCAFIGALLAMLAVYNLARINGRLPVETFLLAGVVVGSFAGAMVSFLMTMAGQDLYKVMLWLLGSLNQSSPYSLNILWPYLLVGGLILWACAPALNIMGMGDDTAASLGLSPERIKLLVIAAGSLVTAAAVACAGLIGFVGLFIPHITRMLAGPDHRLLLPASALNGASFLILADTVARTAFAPSELPVGVLTALIGAPFFFIVLHSTRRSF